VKGDESLLLISEKGILIRTSVAQINSIGRNTQGVRVMNLTSGDKVQRVAIMRTEEYEDKPQNEKESEENNEKINTNNNEFNNKVQPQN